MRDNDRIGIAEKLALALEDLLFQMETADGVAQLSDDKARGVLEEYRGREVIEGNSSVRGTGK